MTFVGAPVIYYGDEVGMLGGDPPECRRPMIWEKGRQNHQLLSLYRRLGSIRRKHEALRRGSFRIVYLDPLRAVLGCERRTRGNRVLVFFNNGLGDAKLSLDEQRLRDELSGRLVHGEELDLPGRTAMVLVACP
jgi:glycosidase